MPKKAKSAAPIVAATGAALAAAAAAAAGAYFLYGKNGAKNRKKVRGWALKAKGEILENIESAKDMSKESYEKLLAEAQKRYSAMPHVDKKELKQMMNELQGHWKSIVKHAAPKKSAKKASKKSVKKAR